MKDLGLPRWQLVVKNPPANEETGSIPGWEDALEEEMAPYSITLARKILWAEEFWRASVHGATQS